jgi:hypothetical protein
MRSRRSRPDKASLVLLFAAAKRRLIRQGGDVSRLPNVRIGSAARELNLIVDDILGAARPPNAPAAAIEQSRSPRAIQLAIHTVGRILRRTKIDK